VVCEGGVRASRAEYPPGLGATVGVECPLGSRRVREAELLSGADPDWSLSSADG
jgi:hypothetical protein